MLVLTACCCNVGTHRVPLQPYESVEPYLRGADTVVFETPNLGLTNMILAGAQHALLAPSMLCWRTAYDFVTWCLVTHHLCHSSRLSHITSVSLPLSVCLCASQSLILSLYVASHSVGVAVWLTCALMVRHKGQQLLQVHHQPTNGKAVCVAPLGTPLLLAPLGP